MERGSSHLKPPACVCRSKEVCLQTGGLLCSVQPYYPPLSARCNLITLPSLLGATLSLFPLCSVQPYHPLLSARCNLITFPSPKNETSLPQPVRLVSQVSLPLITQGQGHCEPSTGHHPFCLGQGGKRWMLDQMKIVQRARHSPQTPGFTSSI